MFMTWTWPSLAARWVTIAGWSLTMRRVHSTSMLCSCGCCFRGCCLERGLTSFFQLQSLSGDFDGRWQASWRVQKFPRERGSI
ncbi:hypothetical protein HOY82DRAFT_563877 [Tuber indicum]|nr:hypothetical protein HOY82DRAFT_563877 [Tuber indicum]